MTVSFPELLLPDQFFSDRLLVGEASGELALRWAVFADGLKRYRQLAADRRCHKSDAFRDEESWIFTDDKNWPFSFWSLCETFGLNPQSVRTTLVSWKNRHAAEHIALS
jgi:hypothetical protein